MKHFKIFSIVLGAHLLAVPIVIIQISRGTGSVSEELAKEVFSDPISLQQISSIKPTSLNIYNSKPTVVHTVQQGENPSAIASRYGMATAELMKLNGIVDARGLRVGDKLMVYIKKS
jgi:LysM repeat protein